MSVEIESRNVLFESFQRRLEATQEDLEDDQTLEYDRKMLKTYIVETNIPYFQFIQDCDFIVESRQIDSDLYEFQISEEDESTKSFYLDCLDDRFWSLHTLVGSQLARRTFQKITTSDGNGLDHPWIPNKTQKDILDLGSFKGAGFNQHGKEAFPKEFVNVSDFRLELDGDDAERFYNEFNDNSNIEKVLSLSRIKIRTKDENGNFLTQRITNEGAFTARAGTDIQIHLDTVNQVKEKYRNIIESIENNHRLNYSERQEGVQVNGEHISIDINNTIKDISTFTSHLVNAKKPFRLIGPTTKIGEEYQKVRAVDLHNGDKVTLEIGPEWIRLYLYGEACGNTALRIFTNIQQYYDPSSTMNIMGVDNV